VSVLPTDLNIYEVSAKSRFLVHLLVNSQVHSTHILFVSQ